MIGDGYSSGCLHRLLVACRCDSFKDVLLSIPRILDPSCGQTKIWAVNRLPVEKVILMENKSFVPA